MQQHGDYAPVSRHRANFDLDRARLTQKKQEPVDLAYAGHLVLDVLGVVDPSPIIDGLNASWYAAEGDETNAKTRIVAMVPYVGDFGKVVKYGSETVHAGVVLRHQDEFLDIIEVGAHRVDNIPGVQYIDNVGLHYAPTRPASRYTRDVFEGRNIYRAADDFDLGVPTNVDPKFVDRRIRQKLENGWTNADLMRNGNAPIGRDGRPINLHHVLGDEPGPMLEILGSTHKQHHRALHGLIEDGNSFRNVPGLKSQYNSFRGRYWQWRIEQLTGN